MSVRMRQEIERKIVVQVIDDLLAAGFAISVEDGAQGIGETVLKRSRDRLKIVSVMFSTDDDRLLVHRPVTSRSFNRQHHGWVDFIYGNDGPDVIHDHTTNLDDVIAHAEAVADYYSN